MYGRGAERSSLASCTQIAMSERENILARFNLDFPVWPIVDQEPLPKNVAADQTRKKSLLDDGTCHDSNNIEAWQISPGKGNCCRIRRIATSHPADGGYPIPIGLEELAGARNLRVYYGQ